MARYQTILHQFQRQGLYQTNQITFNEVKRALDAICSQNTGNYQFNYEISDQIWKQTVDRNAGDPVMLKDYIKTIIQAENILQEQVRQTQQNIRVEQDEKVRQQMLSDLLSYSQDHRILASAFGITQLRNSKKYGQASDMRYSKSVLFTDVLDQREESTDIKFSLYISIAVLIVQFIVMFQKHHFFNMLCIALIVSIFVLSYFEKKYISVTLIALSISGLLDIVWLIVHTSEFWAPAPQTQHSTIQTNLLRFIIILVCLSIVGRLAIIGLLFKYKSVHENVKKKVNLFGAVLNLDANPDPHNLLMNIMKPQNQKLNPFQQQGF